MFRGHFSYFNLLHIKDSGICIFQQQFRTLQQHTKPSYQHVITLLVQSRDYYERYQITTMSS